MARRIGIIGGGVAGISAALEATSSGAAVELFEATSHLGGRAAAGQDWDTGRHLITTACHQFLWLTERLATTSVLSMRPLALGAIVGNRRPFWFLEKPLHGASAPLIGLLSAGILPFFERLGALPALSKSIEEAPEPLPDPDIIGSPDNPLVITPGPTVSEHFTTARWPGSLIQRIGEPLAHSICNLSPDSAAAGPFLTALHLILDQPVKRAGWVRGNGGRLISDTAPLVLAENGVKLHLRTPIINIRHDKSGWTIESASGSATFEAIVVTAPPGRLGFLKKCDEVFPLRQAMEEITGQTIITLRARFLNVEALPGPITEINRDHPVWFLEPAPEGGVMVERVLSGVSDDYNCNVEREKAGFLEHATRFFGAGRPISDVNVIQFGKATPSITPGVKRPVLHQAEGFFYAGDISATGLPATIESAAWAGRLAGRTVVEA